MFTFSCFDFSLIFLDIALAENVTLRCKEGSVFSPNSSKASKEITAQCILSPDTYSPILVASLSEPNQGVPDCLKGCTDDLDCDTESECLMGKRKFSREPVK